MIKLRTKDGKRLKVSQDVPFIEICDADGDIGALVHILDNGYIIVSMPGDDTFTKYVKTFGVKLATLIKPQ